MKYTGIAKEFIEWAELYRKPFITDVTWIKYELAARRFQTMFLDMKAKDLTRALVQRAYNDLAGQYSDGMLKSEKNYLKSMVLEMYADGKIKRNFMVGIKTRGKQPTIKKKFLEKKERMDILNNLNLENEYAMMIYIALMTGMRMSEILAITKQDLIKKGGKFFINCDKTFCYKYKKDFMPTKTKNSVREIPITDHVLYNIKSFKPDWRKEERLFENYKVHAARVNKYLANLCQNLKISPVSFHCLRHTYGSFLIAEGIPMITVSKLMGHASLAITQDVYIHLMQDQRRKDERMILKLLET